ncbi:MAG: DinB family protein [Bacteroidetes bacterium]|nr:DinB family protein [Bacteroidota bacterium]
MEKRTVLEFWLRGPVAGIPPLLQPVAHALLQAKEEVKELMEGFGEEELWERPAGVASAGFHLRHLTGVLDRLFTYARGEVLKPEQLAYLGREGEAGPEGAGELVDAFNKQIDKSLDELGAVSEGTLTAYRDVGRNKAPSTVLGLLFHAAEHTQRHVGQLLVTVRVLKGR